MKAVYIYSDELGAFSYGEGHPMRPMRLRLSHELTQSLGLFDGPGVKEIEARKATEAEMLLFHTAEYLGVLKAANDGSVGPEAARHGLGHGDNPAFPGVYDWSALSTGASLQAAELVACGKAGVAFNIAGGLHHAMADRASGFCYINDPAVAIKSLVNIGKRVAYVDIDAHHGDGVEAAFMDTDRVLTISIHESGEYLFPGTGFTNDMGAGEGLGYAVNLPLPPGAGDELFLFAFNEIVPGFLDAFRPDVLVTQLGVDTFGNDPLTHLELTTNGFEEMVKAFKSFDLPWVALGGGGYDAGNVARAWTLAWAVMAGREVKNAIPDKLSAELMEALGGRGLRDRPPLGPAPSKEARADAQRMIDELKSRNLKLIRRSS
jgi:acetoin utilization protein AcuC